MEIKKMSGRLAIQIVRLRFWALVVLGVAGLSPSVVMAQMAGCIAYPIIETFEYCTLTEGNPNRRCEYRNILKGYNIVSCPPVPPPAPTAPQSPPPSAERQKCLDEAAKAGKQCQEAYGAAKNMCDTSNALLGGGVGRLAMSFAAWKQLVSKDALELVERATTVAGGSLGFTAETIFPCEQWNSMAMGYCSGGAKQLETKCPAK